MHESPAGFTWGNTATSVIIELDPSRHLPPRLWVAYQPPCASVYVGFSWTDALPELLTRAGKAGLDVRAPCDALADEFESSSLWWRLYRLVRAVGETPATRYPEVRKRFVDVEKQSFKAMDTLRDLDEQLERITGTIERLEKAWHLE
jgi:secernin